MRALVTDPTASPPLRLADVPEPSPAPGHLLVRMAATSLNRGEIRGAAARPAGTVIGWDVAGTVVELGEDVQGFAVGERVVGLTSPGGAFAELVSVPAKWTSPLPAQCDLVLAATLPVAGITAVGVLRLGGVRAGERVLVTGAAGGVGRLAVQLAVQSGARATGQAGSEQRAQSIREAGADALVHAGDGAEVPGTFDVVLDGIGGAMLRPLLTATAPLGRVVLYGNSADAESTIRVEDVYGRGLTIHGFRVFTNVTPEQAMRDLSGLAAQVVAGTLDTRVQATAPLTDALDLVRDLYERKVTGKAVIVGT